MARKTYGITTSEITWEKTESEIDVSETGMVTINVSGAVNSTGIGLLDALRLVPAKLPTGVNGPIGNASEFANASLSTKRAYYKEGTWQVEASYQIGDAPTSNQDGQDVSDSDRYERRIVVSAEPIMTHPCAMDFDVKEKNKLANLLAGNIEANTAEDYDGGAEREFVRAGAAEGETPIPVAFSEEAVEVDGISLSPLEVARLIKAGVTEYQRKTIRHSWSTTRNNPAPTAQYKAVGTVVSTPQGAPQLSGGYQWMLTGIVDSSSNDDSWNTTYEFDASGAGGFLKIYKGGTGEL